MAVTAGSQQGNVQVTGVRVLGRQSMCLDKYMGSRPPLQGGLGRVRGKRSGPPTLVLRIRVAKQGGEVGLALSHWTWKLNALDSKCFG